MKPVQSYIIEDDMGNVIFKFPIGTLLDRITDVWEIIVNYHNNCYPFCMNRSDNNYRELTLSECNSKLFTRLFSIAHNNNRIKNIVYGGNFFIGEYKYALFMDDHQLYKNNDGTLLMVIIEDGRISYKHIEKITKIYAQEYTRPINKFLFPTLRVLSDIVFDE